MELVSKLFAIVMGALSLSAGAIGTPAVENYVTRAGVASPAIQQEQEAARAEVVPAEDSSASYNWAGYVASGGDYTEVSGTWIVPYVENLDGNGADATWVGIGGVGRHDLIQAGTEALPLEDGSVVYAAWYELLPDDSHMVPFKVAPGDSVTVTVKEETTNHWVIDFENNTTGDSYKKRVAYESSYASAEWIEEMPLSPDVPLTLNHFGVVEFTDGHAVQDGELVSIEESGAKPLRMENGGGETLAIVSEIGKDGESFSVARTDADSDPLQHVMRERFRAEPRVTEVAGETSEEAVRTIVFDDGWSIVVVRFFAD